MTRRYYPSTRERLTRAFDEGARSDGSAPIPYASRNSGRALRWAFIRGKWLARGVDFRSLRMPVDLSVEFRDVMREVEADPPAALRGAA